MIKNILGIIMAERQGFEPWQRLHVDRLAICSITTLAPLHLDFKISFSKESKQFFIEIIQDIQFLIDKH